jgi:hypothetical protein
MLTDLECRYAERGKKVRKLYDHEGLYLRILLNGSKLWQWKYHCGGKEKIFSIGPYPKISLSEAEMPEMRLNGSSRQASIPLPNAVCCGSSGSMPRH